MLGRILICLAALMLFVVLFLLVTAYNAIHEQISRLAMAVNRGLRGLRNRR